MALISNNYNDTCAVTCNGYNLNGPLEKTCQANGLWSGNDNSCVPANCGEVIIENGTMTCPAGGTTYPNTCTVSCNNGHNLAGVNSLMCTANGTWGNTAPTCTPVSCLATDLPAPPFGSKQCPNGSTFGNSCTFTCQEGYTLSNDTPITCYADGNWSNESPTCVPASCPTLSAISDGTISLSDDTGTFGDTATYSCDTGYHLEVTTCFTDENNDGGTTEETCTTTEPSAWSRFCESDGTWSNQVATCVPDSCAALPQVENATAWDCTNNDLFGSQCSLTCLLGHDLSGDATRSCGTDGWSGDAPTCAPKDCGTVTAPENGFVELGELGSLYGGAATYSCALGYKLIAYNGVSVGSATTESTCTSNGVWSPAPPTCAVQTCTELPTPTNGTLSYTNPDNTTHVGAEATFTCEDGYHLEAGDQSPSNWTIQCDGTTDGNDGQWSGAVATCEPNVCGTLNLVDNGTWDCDLGENIFGETCNIVCDPGYEQVAGSPSRSCVYESLQTAWNGFQPVCFNIDECNSDDHTVNCDANATCNDIAPTSGDDFGYTCACNTGYVDGSNNAGTYCTLATCDPFYDYVIHAAPPIGDNASYGSTADIVCDPGFQYVGDEVNGTHGVVTCNVEDGQGGFTWTTPGTCENINECTATNTEGEIIGNCGENGHCIDDTGDTAGWFCGCDAGYETVGQWDSDDSDNQPGCDPMACPAYPDSVANGNVLPAPGNSVYLSETAIICDAGYTYVGNDSVQTADPYKSDGTITCNVIENGNPTWNAVGTCEDIDECTATDAQGEIVGDCGPNSLACVNDVAGWHCDCKPGFEPSGDWTDENNLPTCVERSWTDVTVGGASEGCMLNPLNKWSYQDSDTGNDVSKKMSLMNR